MLEKKERFLQKKSSAEIEKAKDYTKAKNKNGKPSGESFIFLSGLTQNLSTQDQNLSTASLCLHV